MFNKKKKVKEMINQKKIIFEVSEFLMTSLSWAVSQKKKIYLVMNHQDGKLIYESCPAGCNVAGRPLQFGSIPLLVMNYRSRQRVLLSKEKEPQKGSQSPRRPTN